MELSQNILKYREQLGLSQEQLAEKLNISPQAIALWETGQEQPTIDTLKILANTFGVSIDQLCGNTPSEDSPRPLFTASAKYTKELYLSTFRQHYKKFLITSLAICCFFAVYFLYAILSLDKIGGAFFPLLMSAIFAFLHFNTKRKISRIATEAMILKPNAQANYTFYIDHLVINTNSDNGFATHIKQYVELTKVTQDEQYLYLTFDGHYTVIDKTTCIENLDQICRLLNVENKQGKFKNYKKLSILFTLSIASIITALFVVATFSALSPLPDFPNTMTEYMWIFLLFIPIPLTSLVLGIMYKRKGYKCKRNIIGGVIISFVLLIYGSFTFAFASETSHDESYLQKIEQQVNFEFPEAQYISIDYGYTYGCESFAMAKFDESDEQHLITKMQASGWKTDKPLIPADSIYSIVTHISTEYDYFAVFSLTDDAYNSFNGQVIYMAYDVETNVLFICCFE